MATKPTLVLLSNLPLEPIPRTSFLQKGLLRLLGEVSTGNFSKIYMPVDKAQNRNIGVAVVKFPSSEEAASKISALNGTEFGGEGRKLRVERVDESEEWEGLVREGRVDGGVVERLECLELVGIGGSM